MTMRNTPRTRNTAGAQGAQGAPAKIPGLLGEFVHLIAVGARDNGTLLHADGTFDEPGTAAAVITEIAEAAGFLTPVPHFPQVVMCITKAICAANRIEARELEIALHYLVALQGTVARLAPSFAALDYASDVYEMTVRERIKSDRR